MQNNNNKKQINPLPFKTPPPNESELYYLFLVLYAWGGIAKLETEISPDLGGQGRKMHCRLPRLMDWARLTPSNQYPAGLQIRLWKRIKTHSGASQLQEI